MALTFEDINPAQFHDGIDFRVAGHDDGGDVWFLLSRLVYADALQIREDIPGHFLRNQVLVRIACISAHDRTRAREQREGGERHHIIPVSFQDIHLAGEAAERARR